MSDLAVRKSDGVQGVILAVNPATGDGGYGPLEVLFQPDGHPARAVWLPLSDLSVQDS